MKNENARRRGDLRTIGSRVCHDLRTPLGGIVAAGELLKETVGNDAATRAALDSLFASVDEMTRLIKCVGVVTKATAEPRAKEIVAMGEIISDVLQRLESRILKKGASIRQPDSWPEIAGGADWLEFVWCQLLANALQHGGPEIELGWDRQKGETRFWIADNGGGVPAELRANYFNPSTRCTRPAAPAAWDCRRCNGWWSCKADDAATTRGNAARNFISHCRRSDNRSAGILAGDFSPHFRKKNANKDGGV